MNGIRGIVRLLLSLAVLSVAVFALLPQSAFAADKTYTSTISPTSGATPTTVTVTITNVGNSAFNSFTLAPPTGSGYTLSGPLTTSRGNIAIVNNTIQVTNINLPNGSGQFHTLTFNVTAPSCSAAGGNWVLTLWTGSGLTGQNFRNIGGALTTSYTATCYTLTYTAGTGGTISGTSPQSVAYLGSGTPVTASANTGYRFVRWSDGSTTNPRTDTNVTANISVTASFAPVMSFGTQPHNALQGGYIGPVTVTATGLDGQTVTLALKPSGTLSGNTATFVNGVATFNTVATATSTAASSGYYLTASVTVPDVQPVDSNTFSVTQATGILDCPSDPNFTTGGYTDQFSGNNPNLPTSGKRQGNKDNSPCIPIPFSIQVTDSPDRVITVTWDEVAQPNVVLEVDAVWPPEVVAAGGQPKVTKYDIGLGLFTVGQCLAKTPAAVDSVTGAPLATQLIGTLAANIDDSTTSIPITFNGAKPAAYPFPIIIRSSTAGMDPERMLVKSGPDANGLYLVDRGTGLTPKSPHSSGFDVMWTAAPVDGGSAINGPAQNGVGGQVGTCDFDVESQPVGLDQCPGDPQTSEPLQACYKKTEKVWVFGDWRMVQ